MRILKGNNTNIGNGNNQKTWNPNPPRTYKKTKEYRDIPTFTMIPDFFIESLQDFEAAGLLSLFLKWSYYKQSLDIPISFSIISKALSKPNRKSQQRLLQILIDRGYIGKTNKDKRITTYHIFIEKIEEDFDFNITDLYPNWKIKY